MSKTEEAIRTVKDEILNYEYGYNQNGMKEKWENVLSKLEQLDHLEKGFKGLLNQ